MNTGVIRAVCFDLDNTLWAIEPVLERAERILADWMRTRYPRIPERFSPADIRTARAALMLELPEKAHDLTFLSLENLARLAQSVGYERDMAREAFAVWHAARNQCVPFDDVIPREDAVGTTWVEPRIVVEVRHMGRTEAGRLRQPVFRGTRVLVTTLFDYLEGGETLDDFLEGFPTVSREVAVAALEEARLLLLARAS